MALAVSNTSQATSALASSLTWSHVQGSGSNRFLIVGIQLWTAGRTVLSCLFGNTPMVPYMRMAEPGGFGTVEYWILYDPPVQTANIVATFSSSNYSHAGAISFTGAHGANKPSLTIPTVAMADAAASSSGSVVLTTLYANSIVIDNFFKRGSVALTVGASQTEAENGADGTAMNGAMSYEAGGSAGSAITMSWDGGTSNFFTIALEVRELDSTAYEQEGYRFRDDDGSESAATFLASQDTSIVRRKALKTRVRIIMNATGNPVSNDFKLEYRRKGSGNTFSKVEVI